MENEMTDKEMENAAHDTALETSEGQREDTKLENTDFLDEFNKVNEIPQGELRGPLEKLNKARQLKTKLKEELDKLKEQYDADNFELIANLEDAKNKVSSLETNTKERILGIYANTGKKTMEFGVVVKIDTEYLYDDDAALDWAKENMRVFILPETLDTKAFHKALTTMKNTPEFVTIQEEPKATLPRDIEKQFLKAGMIPVSRDYEAK